ncbi:MAG: hypothetical protein JXP48_04475 [Acidobacteria bacterium]|nr:hypothetical protein [Acidobacteriota bacterium]
MTDTLAYRGLCETCEHDATCMLHRSSRLEIIQCEEFSTRPAVTRPPSPLETGAIEHPMDAFRMGLCANCLNVAGCGFPDACRGVLQCEEYILDEAGAVARAKAEDSRSAA